MIFSKRLFLAPLLAIATLISHPAAAQDWITRAACAIKSPRIDPEVINPEWLAREEIAVENGTGRLWRVTSKDGAVSHLWGTFHSNDPLIVDLPDELRSVIDHARVIAPELTWDFKTRADFEAAVRPAWFWNSEVTSHEPEFLDPRVKEWVRARLKSLGHEEYALKFITLPALWSVLALGPCTDFSSWTVPIQDTWIELLGMDSGAEIIGLEQYDRTILDLAKYNHRRTVVASVKVWAAYLNPENFSARRSTEFHLYLSGRIGALMALERELLGDVYGQIEADRLLRDTDTYFLEERNRGFVENAVPLLEQGNALIAVGCFHLPGPTGLVRMLRDRGYEVERVPVIGEIGGN
ncbi:MAG: TraB/GumN family protein [Rhodobacteraceae bacterium]|nr:TraB/GumN family protein [Paracoccaceae bacterium]